MSTIHGRIAAEIQAERMRQISSEGWTLPHDDAHDGGEMAKAAACYAYYASLPDNTREVDAYPIDGRYESTAIAVVQRMWKWDWKWWKPKDRRRDLVRAGALIIAEIERLDRLAAKNR